MRPFFLGWDCVEPFEAALKLQFVHSTHYMEKNPRFPQTLISL